MAQEKAPEAPPARVATGLEISQAIEELTEEDSERLEQTAINRICRIGRLAAHNRTHEDLIQEAMCRILDGTRQWRPENVKFVPFLLGVIWSISSEWASHHERNPDSPEYAAIESQITKVDDEGNSHSPFEAIASTQPDVEDEIVRAELESEQKALLQQIEAHFSKDENASYVLMGWSDGMDGPAIRELFGLDETAYRTIVRRIRRYSQKIIRKGDGQKSK